MSYAWLDEQEATTHKPAMILLDGRNHVVR